MIHASCPLTAQVCKKADTDNDGTIAEAEATEIWQQLLSAFMKFIAEKLQKLGVAMRKQPSTEVDC